MFTFKINRNVWIVGVEASKIACNRLYEIGRFYDFILGWPGFGNFKNHLLRVTKDVNSQNNANYYIFTIPSPTREFYLQSFDRIINNNLNYYAKYTPAFVRVIEILDHLHIAAKSTFHNFPLKKVINNEELKRYTILAKAIFESN